MVGRESMIFLKIYVISYGLSYICKCKITIELFHIFVIHGLNRVYLAASIGILKSKLKKKS